MYFALFRRRMLFVYYIVLAKSPIELTRNRRSKLTHKKTLNAHRLRARAHVLTESKKRPWLDHPPKPYSTSGATALQLYACLPPAESTRNTS